MGNQQYQERRNQSDYNRWNSSRFHQVSGINPSQFQQIQQEFFRAAGGDGLIDRAEFARLYRHFNLGAYNEFEIERAFRALDRDRSGKLSFDEFLSATVLLNNDVNPRERMLHLIEMNQPGGMNNTFITPEYGRAIVQNMNQFYGTNADFDNIWSGINPQGGTIRQEEFVTYISQAPAFSRHF